MAAARRRPPAATPSGRPPLSPRRRALFAGITLAIPVLALGLLELGLRAGGFGGSYPLFVPYPERPEWLFPNQQVARRYFRPGTLTPLPHLDFFRAEKPADGIRIVFQGESSAAGFPYRHGGAPSRMLEQRLQATFPTRTIEVVNTALTGINSYTLLDLADEIVEQRPDAVMIYAGHNEYYGVFGAGSTRSVGGSRALVRAYLALRRFRTVQLVERVMATRGSAAASGSAAADSPRTAMELLAGEQRIPLGSRRYEQGLAQFRGNLDALLARYREAGIPVLIGTVASNERDQPPFVSGLAEGTDSAAWWRGLRGGLDALARGDTAAAQRAIEAAVAADDGAADAHFALARLLDSRGDTVGARRHYRAAKERDQLRFRAPEAVNAIIREEAARHGATVVETQRALERASPGGVVGERVMLEHLHPNIEGYFAIADAFYEALRGRGSFGDWTHVVPAERARREVPVTPLDSTVGVLRVDRLRSAWPFRPRGIAVVPVVDTMTPRTVVERLARDVVLGGVSWVEATDRLRAHYEEAGDWENAARVASAMAQEFRYSADPRMDAARIAIAQRRYDEALAQVREANLRRETPNAVRLEGLLLLRAGEHAAGEARLRRALQLAPGDERTRVALTAAGTLPRLEEARRRSPSDTAVLYDLAVSLALTQQYERSREALSALERVAPGHAGARELLRKLPPS